MNNILKEVARKHRDRLQIISVEHLEDLRNELEIFKSSEELNGFQQWIVNDLYHFGIPDTGFKVESILLLALYHPFYADIEFVYENKLYHTKSLLNVDVDKARGYLTDILKLHNYHAFEYGRLPLKRLAVQSGLAEYGRNNITYVDGLGSNVIYLAFFSDVPCENDEWRKQCVSEQCNGCDICISSCPTGAILKNRFLIDNQRCLSCLNEGGGEFPEWLPENVHHTLYDCLRCQENCSMNKDVSKDIIGPIRFSEEEINKLLQGKGPEDFDENFLRKANKIGLFNWPQGLARNILAVMKAYDNA